MEQFIGAVDQGTTSTRFILFNHRGEIVGSEQKEHTQFFSKPGWVEHDPLEIWSSTQHVIRAALMRAGINGSELAAIGVTDQRENHARNSYHLMGQPVGNGRLRANDKMRLSSLAGFPTQICKKSDHIPFDIFFLSQVSLKVGDGVEICNAC